MNLPSKLSVIIENIRGIVYNHLDIFTLNFLILKVFFSSKIPMNQANQDIIDSEFSDETFLNELNKYPIVMYYLYIFLSLFD